MIKEYVIQLLENPQGNEQIPIFLPAASWQDSSNFIGWIISTAEKLYDIPRSIVEGILTNYKDKVALVIDGLDEINIAHRENFVKELNNYSAENRIVVSCRYEDFRSLTIHTKVRVNMALKLEPLSDDQITDIVRVNLPDSYLFFKNKNLSKILNTPLLLGLYTKVFGAKANPADWNLEAMDADAIQSLLWQEYIDQAYSLKKDGLVDGETETEEEDGGLGHFITPSPVFKFNFDKTTLQQYGSRLAEKISTNHFSISNIQPRSIFDWYGRLVYVLLTQVILGLFIAVGLGLVMGGPLEFLTGGLLGGLLSTIFYVMSHSKEVFKLSDESSRKSLSGFKGFLKKGIHLIAYFLFLLFGLAFYFCLSGKRRSMEEFLGQADMVAVDDFPIALMFAVIFSLILGFHQIGHNLSNDIRLIDSQQNISKNLRHGILHGLLFSVILAPLVGGVGNLYIYVFPNQIFSEWMTSNLAGWEFGLFQFAVIVVFPIAFLLGFAVGLNNRTPITLRPDTEGENEAETWRKQQKSQLKPYYSIRRTVKATLLFWLIFSLFGAILWGGMSNFLFQNGWDSINKGVESALGGGIFVGLYWGGKDLIKMWILRLIMYVRKELPLQHSKLLYELEIVGILKRQGALFHYAHPTLKEYLTQKKESASDYKSLIRISLITTGILAFVLFSVNSKIKGRQVHFWNNQIGVQIMENNDFEKVAYNSVKCTKSGSVFVESSGKISAGRALGHVSSIGTEIGFFAISLGDQFDVPALTSFRHGELLYRTNGQDSWKRVFRHAKVPPFSNFRFNLSFVDTIQVQKGDTLEFTINDKEPENDSGQFKIKLDFVEEKGLE